MKSWKIIIAGIVFAIIAQLVHSTEAYATMNFYADPAYCQCDMQTGKVGVCIWSSLMMPTCGAPPTEFYYYSIMFGVISGIIYAIVYEFVKKSLPGKSITKMGLYFGFLLFLISISWSLTLYLLINMPTMLLIYWAISSLVIDLVGGVVIARILK